MKNDNLEKSTPAIAQASKTAKAICGLTKKTKNNPIKKIIKFLEKLLLEKIIKASPKNTKLSFPSAELQKLNDGKNNIKEYFFKKL